MTEEIIGYKYFPDKIEITDPCYDKDVWCRINNFPIIPGEYECYIVVANNEETGSWGNRVAKIGIRMDHADTFEKKGFIGVDGGLAGFFINKPDYSDDEWKEFCHKIEEGNTWIFDEGFFSSSGYGDGSYSVYAGYKNGKIVEVLIDFGIEDDEEE